MKAELDPGSLGSCSGSSPVPEVVCLLWPCLPITQLHINPSCSPQARATAGPCFFLLFIFPLKRVSSEFWMHCLPRNPSERGGLPHVFLLTKWTFGFLHLSIRFAKGGQFNPGADPRNSLACSRQSKESLNEASDYKDWIWDQCLRLIASCLIIYTPGTHPVFQYMDWIKMRQDSSQPKPSRISLPVQGWVGELFLQGKITF